MAANWEGRDFDVTFSTMGGPLLQPPHYKFKLERKALTGTSFYYSLAANAMNPPPPNALTGCTLLHQTGKPLLHYLPPGKRLDAESPNYNRDLEFLIDEIVCSKIEPDPGSYERLVGFIPLGGKPVNLVTFYKVENTHTKGELLLIVLVEPDGAAPGGSIGVIGR